MQEVRPHANWPVKRLALIALVVLAGCASETRGIGATVYVGIGDGPTPVARTREASHQLDELIWQGDLVGIGALAGSDRVIYVPSCTPANLETSVGNDRELLLPDGSSAWVNASRMSTQC